MNLYLNRLLERSGQCETQNSIYTVWQGSLTYVGYVSTHRTREGGGFGKGILRLIDGSRAALAFAENVGIGNYQGPMGSLLEQARVDNK